MLQPIDGRYFLTPWFLVTTGLILAGLVAWFIQAVRRAQPSWKRRAPLLVLLRDAMREARG